MLLRERREGLLEERSGAMAGNVLPTGVVRELGPATFSD